MCDFNAAQFRMFLTLSPPRAGFLAQGKSVSNTMHWKSGKKNMADNAASYRGRFLWRGVFLLQLGSQINFPKLPARKNMAISPENFELP